jgi:hypothetical protein
MIYKHQKENDVNDVALINGTYRIVYAVPVVTNGNQTISLYDTFESLGWIELNSSMRSPLQVENDLRQKIEKITTEASFKYDKRTGRLTFNGDFPSNLVISGVGIIQQDIEKQFNQELFGVEVASGSYAEFYQNFITERDGFACDEIFTQEQIQAIITKAIEVKIADAKSTTAKTTTAKTKVNPNAVDIVSLFRKDTREAISFDTWRNQTLSNLNVIMSSPFKPFTLFNVPDDQEINTTCIAEESKRGLSVKNIDPRYNDRYQEQGLALLLRQTIKNLYTNRGRGLEGDESQQAFKEVGKNGKHNGNHNGFLQGEDDEETLIEPKNKKLLKKQIKGRGGRGW